MSAQREPAKMTICSVLTLALQEMGLYRNGFAGLG